MRRLRRSDRGVVLVEFAFIATFLALLAFGVTEIGSAWQSRMTVQAASRSGARVASSLTTNAAADYNTLLAVKSALADIGLTNVEHVVIYKSVVAGGAVPTACTTPSVVSVSGSCNAYTGAQIIAMTAGQFGCGVGKLDNAWCPTTRQNLLAFGTDYLGVWIRVKQPNLAKVLGNGVQRISDSSVMRLEPLT